MQTQINMESRLFYQSETAGRKKLSALEFGIDMNINTPGSLMIAKGLPPSFTSKIRQLYA